MGIRAHTDFGETRAADYDAASRRDLTFIAALGAVLFAGFVAIDVATHPGDHTTARFLTSAVPAVILAGIALISARRLPNRLAPWAAVLGGLVAVTGPLATVVVTRHATDLAYAMLIIATTGAVVYRLRAFWCFSTLAMVAYVGVAVSAPITRDSREDWIAAGLMAFGLAAALFSARRFAVRQIADANDRLTYLAGHDALTGLVNRHSLETSGQSLVSLARREGRDVFATFIDIDGLSTVNNAHGHGAGDDVIRAVASAILDAVREADVVARWGGDEIVIVGIGDGPDAERLEASIRSLAPPRAGVPGWDGQVSVGGASIRGRKADFDALILAADAAMYDRRGLRRDGAA